MRRTVVAPAMIAALLVGRVAHAQSRPLQTQDPETVPAGNILFEAGLGYEQKVFYPASGLTGNLTRILPLGLTFGVSSMAEIQFYGGVRDHLSITKYEPAPLSSLLTVTGDSTSDVEDIVIGAKVRFARETENRPAMAVRFTTRLPNAGNESGLGLNTTDFNFYLNLGKTVRSTRVVGNIGFGILGDPVHGYIQNDVFNYGISVARAVATGAEIVFEVNGRQNTRSGTPPVGTESRSQMRFGGRYTTGQVRLDAAILVGLTSFDPTWGFTTGVTWVFKAFDVK
ncbi:MAG TPA: transporter [Vicinamibacterales bacterium]|nr:transporter [Vicinamibacterales bacterium]